MRLAPIVEIPPGERWRGQRRGVQVERYRKLTRLAMPTGSLPKHSARIQDEDSFNR